MPEDREKILCCFEQISDLFCQLGFFVEGNSNNGIHVLFWRNGRLRKVSEYMGGMRDGCELSYSSNRMLTTAICRRMGSKHGESVYVDPKSGHVLKDVFVRNGVETRARDADKGSFGEYIVSPEKLSLVQTYEPLGAFLRTYFQ